MNVRASDSNTPRGLWDSRGLCLLGGILARKPRQIMVRHRGVTDCVPVVLSRSWENPGFVVELAAVVDVVARTNVGGFMALTCFWKRGFQEGT